MMLSYFAVMVVSCGIGLGAGVCWASAVREAEKAEHSRVENELLQEIKRQRILVSKIIGVEDGES